MCGGRRPGLLLGRQRLRAAGQQQHHRLDGAGGGGHSGVLAGKTVTAISAGQDHTCAVADGRAYCWGCNAYGQLGERQHRRFDGAGGGGHSGVLAGKTVTAISAGGAPHVCGGRRQGVLLGRQRLRPVGQQQHHRLAGAGGGGHVRGAGRQDGHRDQRRRLTTRVRWPTAGRTAGATTPTGSSATTAPPRRGAGGGGHRRGADRQDGHRDHRRRSYHTCAVADGRAYCWGYNYGQLGNNSTTNSTGAGGGGHLRGAGRQDRHRDHRRLRSTRRCWLRLCRSRRLRWPGRPGTGR